MTLPGRVPLVILLGQQPATRATIVPTLRKRLHAPEEEASWVELLARADTEAAMTCFRREKSETLNQFGNRILAAAKEKPVCDKLGNWYITCAALRCDGTSVEETTTVLQEQLNQSLNTST